MASCCSVSWCAALTEGQFCAVHAKRGKDFRLGDEVPAAKVTECEDCGGTKECEDCYGDGTHQCEHDHCSHQHDCETCDGSGECRTCSKPKVSKKSTFEERYIAWAFDPGYVPLPPMFDQPWDVAA